jgi:hypothetical protein
MKNKTELLQEVLKKYIPGLDEQKRIFLSKELAKIKSSGRMMTE